MTRAQLWWQRQQVEAAAWVLAHGVPSRGLTLTLSLRQRQDMTGQLTRTKCVATCYIQYGSMSNPVVNRIPGDGFLGHLDIGEWGPLWPKPGVVQATRDVQQYFGIDAPPYRLAIGWRDERYHNHNIALRYFGAVIHNGHITYHPEVDYAAV